jgi:pimeloyl-ACP methyl ester carboxylesterase
MRRTLSATLALVVAGVVPVACTDSATKSTEPSSGQSTEQSSGTADGSDPFGFTSARDDGRVEIGHLQVPIDYDDPSQGTFDLYVARHLADPDLRIGSLLVNPGGPGFGGSRFAINAENVYSEDLLAHFDIIGWDPRGTGRTEPAIDCIDDYDHFYAGSDITPDDPAERQQIIDVAQEFADACTTKNAAIIEHVGTNDTARDMNSIREALGEDKISYFGFSYGSELGATWATLFPDTVRAAVLDGAADPDAGMVEATVQQMTGFEGTLRTFLAQCSDDDSCAFHNDGNAEQAFDDLMASLDADPIPSTDGRPPVNLQVAVTAASQAMYSDRLWPQLAEALATAQGGDGSGLLALYDMYFNRADDGSYPDSLEAFQTIFCMDRTERLTVAEDDATVPQLQSAAPRLAPGTTGAYFCSFFPPTTDPRATVTGKGAGPILVMGTTGDAATPLASTRNMAAALEDGRLVIVTGNQHTGYNLSRCSVSTVDQYLLDPVANAPEDGTTCD